MRRVLAAAAVLALAGCVVMVPVRTSDYDERCGIVTHHMELQAVQVASVQQCGNQGCAEAALVAAGVAAASTLVSGSIMVVGNIVYWADRQVNCRPTPVPVPAVPAAAAPGTGVAPDPSAPQ